MFIYQGLRFLQHFFLLVDQHSLHSPFLFHYYSNAVKGTDLKDFDEIETYRRVLLANHDQIHTTDFGTGNSSRQVISSIAKRSLAKPRFSRFLNRTGRFLGARDILELGTSLGINTLYLAMVPEARITTVEGCPQTAALAQDIFRQSGRTNIDLINGRVEDELPRIASSRTKFDLLFIDANHRYHPTLSYYKLCLKIVDKKSMLIIHDIHVSPEMDRVWNEIRNDAAAILTLDLFVCGIVLFDQGLNRQSLRLSL
jgi:predicted O-methyltransferase YrrM